MHLLGGDAGRAEEPAWGMVEGLAFHSPIAVTLFKIGKDDVGARGSYRFIGSVRSQRREQQGGEEGEGGFHEMDYLAFHVGRRART